jgi:hypothetical protein
MDEALAKADPHKAMLDKYSEQLSCLSRTESTTVYTYTMLVDWVTKLLIAQIADWTPTPLGHVLYCKPIVSETLGFDSDDLNLVVPDSMSWFKDVKWIEAQLVNDSILLKLTMDFQCFWIRFELNNEVTTLLSNCSSLFIKTVSGEKGKKSIDLTVVQPNVT